MRYQICSLAVAAMITLGTAAAQAKSGSDEPSVAKYLCTFAGKCGDAAAGSASGEEVAIAAPATKGFRVARAGTFKPQPVAAIRAPEMKGFRVAKIDAAPVTLRRQSRPQPAANNYARPVPAVAPGAGRADLMIGFELGSDRMTASGRRKAAIFARSLGLSELSGMRFAIEGHTDTRGNADANRDLSRRRAEAVAQFLSENGVDRSRLTVKGMGSDAPLSGHAASDPANRRVEAELLR